MDNICVNIGALVYKITCDANITLERTKRQKDKGRIY